MTALRWGRRIATGVVLVGLVAIGLGRGVGAQTGPAFSAQIQLALRALLAGDQTITGDWTCTGTCTGFGGGGGGTPASPDTSVQFNNGGSFGGSSSLTWDGTTLLGNSFVTAATDTGATFHGSPVKTLIQSASDGAWQLAVSSAASDPDHYGLLFGFDDGQKAGGIYGGLDDEIALSFIPSDYSDAGRAGAIVSQGDFVSDAGGPFNLGRASNPWAAVYTNAYRGISTGTTLESYQQPPATPADPVLAGAGAGNVNNGTHRYVFTFSDSDGHETSPSTPTGAVTVTDNTTNGKVTVTVPYACNTLLPNQNIYRDFNGDGVFKLARAGAYDCMTTWEDNVANADLGAPAPMTSTALLPWTFQGDTLVLPDSSDFGRTVFLGDRGAPDTFGGRSVGVSPVEYGSGQAGSLFLSSGSSPTSTSFAAVALYGAGAFREGAWLNTFNSDVVVNAAGTGSFRARVNGTERLNIIGDRMTGDVDFDLASHFQQFTEISAPAAPSANQGRLFLQDNGAGKSQLCVRFNTGAAQCFATEP